MATRQENRPQVFTPNAKITVAAAMTSRIVMDTWRESLGRFSSHASVLCRSVVGHGLTGIKRCRADPVTCAYSRLATRLLQRFRTLLRHSVLASCCPHLTQCTYAPCTRPRQLNQERDCRQSLWNAMMRNGAVSARAPTEVWPGV